MGVLRKSFCFTYILIKGITTSNKLINKEQINFTSFTCIYWNHEAELYLIATCDLSSQILTDINPKLNCETAHSINGLLLLNQIWDLDEL